MKLVDAVQIMRNLPNDLPYKASVKRVLIQAPEVDAEPVVRCRECKYRTKETRWTRAGFCGRREAGDFFATLPDGFCNYGEKEETV